jgi:ribosomal subunit interface protein
MTVSIEARNFELTDAIRDRVEKMVETCFSVYTEKIEKITVILDYASHRKGDQPNADVKVILAVPGPDIVANNKYNDLYEAVDGALDKAKDQLQERKEGK